MKGCGHLDGSLYGRYGGQIISNHAGLVMPLKRQRCSPPCKEEPSSYSSSSSEPHASPWQCVINFNTPDSSQRRYWRQRMEEEGLVSGFEDSCRN